MHVSVADFELRSANIGILLQHMACVFRVSNFSELLNGLGSRGKH